MSPSQTLAESILHDHQLAANNLHCLTGWSNEVWLTDDVVVRLSSGRFRQSFQHEVAINALVKESVRVPEIIAYGAADGREWMIQARITGPSLLYQWSQLTQGERVEAMTQLGAQLQALHRITVPPDLNNPWMTDAMNDQRKTRDLYMLAPQHFERLLTSLEQDGMIELPLASNVRHFMNQQLSLFNDDQQVLIHGDIHLNNLMWSEGKLTLIDFELGMNAAADRELQCIRDYTRRPDRLFRAGETPLLKADDLDVVIPVLMAVYPELFSGQTEARQRVYALLRDLLQLYHFEPGSRHDPRPRIKATIASPL